MFAIAVLASAAIGFLLSGVVYALAPTIQTYPGHEPPTRSIAATAAVELARGALVGASMAAVARATDVHGGLDGALLGLALWAVPVAILAGAAFHEGANALATTLHAFDWLLKLVAIGAVVGAVTS